MRMMNSCLIISLQEVKQFSAETLAAVEGEFTASEFVKKTVGVDNVCERAVCAVGAKITEKKTALNGTALALGRINTEIDFLKG